MKLFLRACMILVVLAAGRATASASPPTSLDLHADRVVYYSNRYIVGAEGHIHIRLSDGTIITGQLFSMDLKLNRYLVAGDVHIDARGVHEVGAGFAGYPDLDRSYFLSSSGSPDKWTYFGLDFHDPHKGRAQPGDAFFIPDVSSEKPYIVASSAIILPNTMVEFNGSRIYVLGVYIPTHSWVEVFSANPNYSQNGFAGASFDIGVPYKGSLHAVSAFHARYSGLNKFFLSFDQHFVWGRDYVVFSINPLTQLHKQYILIGYKRISPKMEVRLFSQLFVEQHGIVQPQTADLYNNAEYTVSLPRSSIEVSADLHNNSLLQYPPGAIVDGAPISELTYDHPDDGQIAWTGRDTALTRSTPIYFRLRSGYGLAHDGYHCGVGAPCLNPTTGVDEGYVLDYFGASRTRVTTITQSFLGFTLYTASLPLDRPHSLNVNLTLDKQRQWFSLPHHIDTTTTTASLSKVYTRKLAFLGAYSVTELGDYYGARQLEFYPAFDPPNTLTFGGVAYPGYAAFRGFSTTRALTGSAVVTPNQYFNYAFTVRRGYDFPAPVPGLFGNPPWQITNEIRLRVAKQILVDVTRTDYLNFGGYRPSFNVQFGP